MNAVTPTGPITPPPSVEQNHNSREDRQHQLPVDKIIKAIVVEGGLDRVILELNQQRISAETYVPLRTGQKINLLVMSGSPKIELRLVEETLQQRLVRFLHLLGHKFDLGKFLNNISLNQPSTIANLSLSARDAINAWLVLQKTNPELLKGSELQQIIHKLGLNLEAVLAHGKDISETSIKSLLSEMMQKLGSTESDMAKKAGNFLQQIELFQLCQIKLAQQDLFFLPLPLGFLDQGYILFDNETKDNTENKLDNQKLSIFLALDGLGSLEICLVIDSNGLDVRINCDSLEKMAYVSEFQDELIDAISDLPLKKISFDSTAETPEVSLLEKLVPKENPVLDTRV